METLIAFLLDNIFIVIVALGFLMSLFGKGKQRGGRMPDFGGGPMQGGPAGRRAHRAEPEGMPPMAETPPAPTVQPYVGEQHGRMEQERHAHVRERSIVSHASAAPAPARPLPGTDRAGRVVQPAPSARPDKTAVPVPGRIDADDLRKAVLWAEILGPPRARKPHGRNRIV